MHAATAVYSALVVFVLGLHTLFIGWLYGRQTVRLSGMLGPKSAIHVVSIELNPKAKP